MLWTGIVLACPSREACLIAHMTVLLRGNYGIHVLYHVAMLSTLLRVLLYMHHPVYTMLRVCL